MLQGRRGKRRGMGLTSAVNQLAHAKCTRLSVQLYNMHTQKAQADLADMAMVMCLVSTISGSSNANEGAGERLLMDTCYHHVVQQ